MNLVKKDEFEALSKVVQKLVIENKNLKKNSKNKSTKKQKSQRRLFLKESKEKIRFS